MQILRLGSNNPEVKKLQEALNVKLVPSPRLVPDGRYGNLTRTAVMRFQHANWLVEDGEAGRCTINAAENGEAYQPILHALSFIAQPTRTTCWATSTAMIKSSSVPIVISQTPPDLITENGGLKNYSGQDDWLTRTRAYASAHGLAFYPPQSWMVSLLQSRLSQSALMFDMLWNALDYAEGSGSPGHMVVVVGIRGDGMEDGVGTTLRIHDPWPPNRGKVYSVNHARWMQEVMTRTYRVFQRR